MQADKAKNRSVILALGAIIQLCIGIIYMWSVFQPYVTTHFNTDPQNISLTSSIMLCCFVLGILVGGQAMDRVRPRYVVVSGSLLFAVGMLLTALLPQEMPQLLYLTYGVISGFGVGVCYTSTITVCQRWFPDRRGFATGVIVCAFGFSLVLLAPVAQELLNRMGVPATFLAFSISFFIICTLCALFIDNPPDYIPASKQAPGQSLAGQYTTGQMLRTPQFYLITLSMMFVTPTYFILNPLFKVLGEQRNLSPALALGGVMITGVASASGRLLAGWISDKIGRRQTIMLLAAITTAAVLCMVVAQGAFYLVTLAAIAFAFGGTSGVFPALTSESFGTQYAGSNYGCVMVGYGVAALASPFIARALRAGTTDYTLSFIVAGVVAVIAFLLMAFYKKPVQK